MRRVLIAVTGLLLFTFSHRAAADTLLLLSLTSDRTAAQLLDLHVGDTVHVSVNLSGTMDPNTMQPAQIGFLATDVDFGSGLTGSVPLPSEPIIPAVTQVNANQFDDPEFDSQSQTGSVGGTYTDYTATSSYPISTDGAFFTFDLQVGLAAAGSSGSISIDSPIATDEFFNQYVTAVTSPLLYHVDDISVAAAPLPSSGEMGIVLLVAAMLVGCVQRTLHYNSTSDGPGFSR